MCLRRESGVQTWEFVVRTLPGCEPGPCALRDTVPSMEGQRWRRRDGLRGDWASCPFGCTPPRSQPSPSFSFQSNSCQALPIAKAIFPDSMGLSVRVEPSPSRARRPGSGPCPSLAGRSEGRCERLAQTSADWLRPWPGQPRGASPAMIRSRSVEVAGVGYRDWSDPCPGGGGLSQFEMFGVWGRNRGRVGRRRRSLWSGLF